jgi:hypothetical protein
LNQEYRQIIGVLTRLEMKLNKVLAIAQGLQRREGVMVQEMQALTDKVMAVETVEASATAAIQAIVAKLNDLAQSGADLAEVKAQALKLASDLDGATAPLAAAIATVPAA